MRPMLGIFAAEIDPSQIASINRIKEWVKQSIQNRNRSIDVSPNVEPSLVWQFVSYAFDYLLAMPAEQFKSLRLHTYHIDGGTYWKVLFARVEDYAPYYSHLCRDLPERFMLSAPQACGEYGHLINGRLVNDAVLRWQELVKALWMSGKLQQLDLVKSPTILEIGGGYGSLAHQLHTLFPHALYFIVDLPETLLFSASYLTLIHGDASVLLVDEETPISREDLRGRSFVLVPNYLLPALSHLRMDLAINVESFQEMTTLQVNQYLAFLQSRTNILLSQNYERSTFNSELGSVTSLLSQFFDLEELPYYSPEPVIKKMRRKIVGQWQLTESAFNRLADMLRPLRSTGAGIRPLSWQPLKRYLAVPR